MATTDEGVDRFSGALPVRLPNDRDPAVGKKGCDHGSLTLSDMIRGEPVKHRQRDDNREIAGRLTVVSDQHRSNDQSALTGTEPDQLLEMIAKLHVHLDDDHWQAVIGAVIERRGKAKRITKRTDCTIATKGLKRGRLTVPNIGANLIL